MPVTRKRHFDHTVTIDDQPIRVQIKRLTVPEYEEFQAQFVAMGEGRGAPIKPAAKLKPREDGTLPEPPEPDPVTLDQVAAHVAYLKANALWVQQVFDAYVTIEAGDVLDEDETGAKVVVTNGRQFADMFAGDPALNEILLHIYIENSLSVADKKKLQSRSASKTGSNDAPSPADPGSAPDPAASPVALNASVDTGDAMALSSATSSGTTGPSC